MQSIVNAASSALGTVTNVASNAATAAANLTGLTPPTSATDTTAHSQSEETHSAIPADAIAGEVIKMDADGLAVFEDKDVRHEVLVKINQLAIDDVKHGLKVLASLDLVTETGKKGIDVILSSTAILCGVTRPMGLDDIGEVEIEEGKSIHIRCHKASATAPAHFHSIDTRPGSEGGAIFKTGSELKWFDY